MKVLVADDDADLRELIAFTLTQAGYFVIKAGDGPAAVRHFQAESPDLVVLDINMPGLSGLSNHACERSLDPPLPRFFFCVFFAMLTSHGQSC